MLIPYINWRFFIFRLSEKNNTCVKFKHVHISYLYTYLSYMYYWQIRGGGALSLLREHFGCLCHWGRSPLMSMSASLLCTFRITCYSQNHRVQNGEFSEKFSCSSSRTRLIFTRENVYTSSHLLHVFIVNLVHLKSLNATYMYMYI